MTVFTTAVAASADDSQETSGTNTLTGTTLNVNFATQIAAVRFLNVTIPPGSTINTSYITFDLPNATYDDPDVTIHGSGEADPAAFTTTTNHLTDRPKTTASVAWTAANIGTGARNSPSLNSLITEIIGLGGWASGNDMAFYLSGSASSSFRFYTYDNGSGAAILYIDYTAPAAGGVPVKMHHYSMMNQ